MSRVLSKYKKMLPNCVKDALRPIHNIVANKYSTELTYWRDIYESEGKNFTNDFYEKILLNIADEENSDFLEDKVVADFGCGPRGSLVWAKPARTRIGIDVLNDKYVDEFSSVMVKHEMIYLKSTEKVIPLPDDSVDVMFTLNAFDHVDSFPLMCSEIIRVMKPGAMFCGSFNLEEIATSAEPQQLNEDIIKRYLLNKLEILNYRVSKKGSGKNLFERFYNNTLEYTKGEEGILWVKARKR